MRIIHRDLNSVLDYSGTWRLHPCPPGGIFQSRLLSIDQCHCHSLVYTLQMHILSLLQRSGLLETGPRRHSVLPLPQMWELSLRIPILLLPPTHLNHHPHRHIPVYKHQVHIGNFVPDQPHITVRVLRRARYTLGLGLRVASRRLFGPLSEPFVQYTGDAARLGDVPILRALYRLWVVEEEPGCLTEVRALAASLEVRPLL